MQTKVAIIRCANYNLSEVTNAIREIFPYFGGIQNIVKKESKVLIKPNLLASAPAAQVVTTHPTVIEGIIENIKEVKKNIFLGDSPGFGTANGVAESCGIKEVCDRHSVKLIEFNNPKWVKTDINEYRKISIASQAFEYDIIINAAKLKAHCQMLLSGGVKNMFGFCIGKTKTYMHLKSGNKHNNFAKMIVKNYSLINPAFTIVDAIFAMEGRGPISGYPRNLGLLIAGIDAVAVDRVIAEILNIYPDKVPVLRAAKELNIGVFDLEKIEIVGTKLDEVKVKDFKLDFELEDIGFSLPRYIKSHIKSLIAKIKELYRKCRRYPNGEDLG